MAPFSRVHSWKRDFHLESQHLQHTHDTGAAASPKTWQMLWASFDVYFFAIRNSLSWKVLDWRLYIKAAIDFTGLPSICLKHGCPEQFCWWEVEVKSSFGCAQKLSLHPGLLLEMFNIIHFSSLSKHCCWVWYKQPASEVVRESGAGGAVTRCPASEVVQFVAAWKRPSRETRDLGDAPLHSRPSPEAACQPQSWCSNTAHCSGSTRTKL